MRLTLIIFFFFPFAFLFAEDVSEEILKIQSIKDQERKALAKSYADEGRELYKKRLYQEASKKFKRALRLNPFDRESERYLIIVESALGSRKSAINQQVDSLENRSLVFEQERYVELDYLVKRADDSYQKTKEIDPRKDISKYLDELKKSESLYRKSNEMALSMRKSPSVLGIIDRVENRLKVLGEDILDAKSIKEEKNRKEVNRVLVRQMKENRAYIDNKIKNILSVIESHIDREEYENAITLSEEILDIEPNNKKALSYRDQSESARHKKSKLANKKLKVEELDRRYLQIKESFIPYASSVVYPDDWKEIKLREKQILKKTEVPEWKTRLMKSLEMRMDFKAVPMPLQDLLAQLSEVTKLNIVLDSKVTEEKDETELELQAIRFEKMKLKYIMNWIVDEVDLSYNLHMDVIYVTLPEGVKDELSTEIIDVQDLLSSRQNFEGGTLNTGAIASDEEVDFAEAPEADEAQERLNSDILLDMIRKSIPDGDWENEEAGIILEFLQSGALFVKNTVFIQNKLVDLLRQLRRTNSIQIEVQARLLTVEKSFFRDIGIDWKGLDITKPLKNGQEQGFYQRNDDGSSFAGSIVNNLAGGAADLGFFLEHSILSSFQAKIVLRAIEEDSEITQLSSPRLVLMNNASSYIQLVRRISYIQSYETQAGEGENSGGTVRPNIVEIDDAQSLSVKATVSSDRKYITLRAKPGFNTVTLGRTASFSGGTGVGSQTFSYPIDLPTIEIKEIRTTAVIPDGGILILGGVAESHEGGQEKGVPVLSKIPGLGRLFRSNHVNDSSRDSMFIIHGKIIIFSEEEDSL